MQMSAEEILLPLSVKEDRRIASMKQASESSKNEWASLWSPSPLGHGRQHTQSQVWLAHDL